MIFMTYWKSEIPSMYFRVAVSITIQIGLRLFLEIISDAWLYAFWFNTVGTLYTTLIFIILSQNMREIF